MKLKHLKRTRQALADFMAKVHELPESTVVDMGHYSECIYHEVTGVEWGTSRVADMLCLLSAKGKYRLDTSITEELYNLFDTDGGNFPHDNSCTKKDWLLAAEVILAQLDLAIAYKRHQKNFNKRMKQAV